MKKTLLLSLSVLLFLWAPISWGATYEIDADHSSVSFKVKHLVISKVRGSFDKYSGTYEFEMGKPTTWKANATIDATSINTNQADRDKHLRSKDFFHTKKFPTITFASTKVTNVKKNRAKLHGNLTLHGVTKPVVMDMEIGGAVTDPWGNKKSAFSLSTTINRKDFGLKWNETLETGGLLVGEEVVIEIEIEGNLKKADKQAKK